MSTVTEPQTWGGGTGTGGRGLARTRPGGETTRKDGRSAERLADGLGWFSIGLGLAEVLAPRGVARLVGVRPSKRSTAVLRATGLREIGHGVAILSEPRPAEWVWTRVAGDMLDLALLGGALATRPEKPGRTLAATLAILGVTALDLMGAQELTLLRKGRLPGTEEGAIRVRESVTILRPIDEVYAFWRDFENLPRFMRHLESVENIGPGRSRWTARAPAGTVAVWEAVVVSDEPNALIAWRSEEGSPVSTSGMVRFNPAPGDLGTEVHVTMEYDPPGGVIGSALAMLFREEPGQQVKDDLRTFKQVMETGEVVVSDATVTRGPHPARPPEDWELARSDLRPLQAVANVGTPAKEER